MLAAGEEQKCSNEGERVDLDFIEAVDPCMHCYCKNGVVKCGKAECPSLEGCHVIPYQYGTAASSCCATCNGCKEDGISYKNGALWGDKTNPCIVKECKAGVITATSALCPVPQCENPVKLEGECCPSCPTCEVKGTEYKEGDTFTPLDDKCVTCSCQNGTSNCLKKACPVLNCHADKIVHLDGECCPKCSGTRKVFLVPGMCLFQHTMVKNGKTSKVDECTNCTCKEGTMSCTRETCPILNCTSDSHVYTDPTSCCPTCRPSSLYKQCEYEGNTYQHGSSWLVQCVHCTCSDGIITCNKQSCDAEQYCPLDTHQLKFTDGECCPTCVERDGMCTVFGDPHYVTFDKKIYDFQGTCKYMLAKDCHSKQFAIYVQNFDRYNMPGAWTKSVTLLIGDTKIGLRKNGKVKINKSLVSLPFSKVGHFNVKYEKENIVVEASFGLKVIWNTESYLELHLSAAFKGKTCGMCGNFNGQPSDDFIGKEKILHPTAIEFAKSWQHGRQDVCSVGVTQQEVQAKCQNNFSKWRRAHQECTILKSMALKDCRKKISVDPYYKSCVTDSCNCPRHRKCTCDVVTAYVRECERSGFYNTEAPLNYSCSRQRRRILQRKTKNLLLEDES
ncbi:BMPER [Bugula neritina]|uniref:BMPER n=1 Tax=Bugula neritina TaxID=10212 RepID=A0A7J7JWQ5_BUGNE|nr:BMPER [Bugula neritina]